MIQETRRRSRPKGALAGWYGQPADGRRATQSFDGWQSIRHATVA
jgi:hypothetical protein